RIDEARDHHPSVKRNDLSVLLAGRRAWRTNIVFAALATFDAQFLRLCLVGEVHDHAAGWPGVDDVRLFALAPRGGLGPFLVVGFVVGGKSPTTDDFI